MAAAPRACVVAEALVRFSADLTRWPSSRPASAPANAFSVAEGAVQWEVARIAKAVVPAIRGVDLPWAVTQGDQRLAASRLGVAGTPSRIIELTHQGDVLGFTTAQLHSRSHNRRRTAAAGKTFSGRLSSPGLLTPVNPVYSVPS